MTEDDYVTASNLAKLRIAREVISRFFVEPPIDGEVYRRMLVSLDQWIEAYERRCE